MSDARRDAGFTLLELLVAAAILALIAVFSWRGLDALLRERETIASSQAVIDATSRAFARIERDALLARDAELAEDGELRLIANPAAEAASAAVAYRVSNGELVRTVNDGSAPIVLMDGIAGGTFDVWVTGQGPGAGWSRQRVATGGAAAPLAPPVSPPANGGTGTGNAAANGGVNNGLNNGPNNGINNGATDGNVAAVAPGTNNARGPNGTPTQPAMATGLRVVVARADGTSLIRIFMIGGGG